MGLASKQDLPALKKEETTWVVKRLLGSVAPVMSAFTQSFSNPFEWFLALLLVVISIGELLGRPVSWIFYALTFAMFLATVIIHLGKEKIPDEKIKKK